MRVILARILAEKVYNEDTYVENKSFLAIQSCTVFFFLPD